MNHPSRFSVTVSVLSGIVHVAALLALFEVLEYTTIDTPIWVGVFSLFAFVQVAVPVLVSAHTRLLAPAGGVVALFAGVGIAELSTAGAQNLFDMYVMSTITGVTVGLVLFAGVVEFVLRRGYALGTGGLRNLPRIPESRRVVIATAAGLVGVPASVLGFFFGGPGTALIVLFFATAAAAIPLRAVCQGGFVTPLGPFVLIVPYVLYGHAFYMAEISGMGLLLLGPAALLSVLAWKLERWVRSRNNGWDGTGFADRNGTR
ncbi:hypothetical protein HALLA_06810 [Halostagnicola larsenii XH-48]|uniref:Uncharacterized protein n=1 Tax=Halostagnicola larsenii XH-48 TaxID=797299 RepID=W0JN60_9EURY|nr:hypothetical protein [Halostagnicola larsenii]AHF98604.1 hypothetical protein HALLA_06810 [Halostagnicola larsenii XH-48]